ncbi:MAG: hypothetical protein K8U03_17005 [Planctomycetia bacterium]|nr:hypothetical protein [Planctomycetia bacterium]
MSKLLSVALLKAGDQFEFVSFRSESSPLSGTKDHHETLVVANMPQVNKAANSCFFRYKSQTNPEDGNRSWNGTADIEVRLLTDRPLSIPAAMPTPASPAAAAVSTTSATPAVKRNETKSSSELPTIEKSAEPAVVVDSTEDSPAEQPTNELAESNGKSVKKKTAAKKTAVGKKSATSAIVKKKSAKSLPKSAPSEKSAKKPVKRPSKKKV